MYNDRRGFPRLAFASICLALFSVSIAGAAGERLTIEDLSADPPISGRELTGLVWRPHSTEFSYLVRKGTGEESVFELWIEDAAKSGKRILVATPGLVIPADPNPTEAATGVERSSSRPRHVSLEHYRWSPDGQTLLLTGDHDLWIYRVAGSRLERLTHGSEDEEVPAFSPDGRRIAFVRKNDLYAIDLSTGRETRLTSDGSEYVFNGQLDWVYEEELGSRASGAFQWSPDGQAIAYLRLDDGPVADAPIVDFLEVPAKVSPQRYPKAGAANPTVSFRIVRPDGTAVAHAAEPV